MSRCPAGHDSTTTDYCDVCGVPMTAAPAAVHGAGAPGGARDERCPDCDWPRDGRFCEACGYDFTTRTAGAGVPQVTGGVTAGGGSAQFGVPAAAGASAQGPASDWGSPRSEPSHAARRTPAGPPKSLMAVVTADRAYFDAVIAEGGPDAATVTFPPYCPERRFPLTGQQIRIGRRSVSRGFVPDIDLSGPPEDPGISHLHVVLLAGPDGSWVVVDPGSTNGTMITRGAESINTKVPIDYNTKVPVGVGDRIHIGAWTTITLWEGA